jgi:LuxR family maltose regulon positive regulatory protein
MLALTCAFRGELKRASRLAGTTGTVAAPALAALALCELEWDDASESRRRADSARDVAEGRGDAAGALIARVIAASAAAADADGAEDARLALAALAADGAERLPLLAPWLLALRCRLGDARFASAALAAADPTPQRRVAAARLALIRRDAGGARAELAEFLAGPDDAPLAVLVEAMVLRSLAAALTGSDEDACAWIECALELAEPEAIRRPFLDGGPTVADVLRHTIRRGSAHRWLAGSLLAVLDGRESPEGHSARELLDPLSDRETIVLRYLPTMMSNQEIAGELFVSVNTIKTHLKSIYRKLGASDRREAVRLARELRLIA